jgi:Flp pilus assembly protein TadD
MADVTQVQGDITRDVSKKLRVHLSGAEEEKLGNAGTTNPEAYRLYLEGRQQWYGRTPEGMTKSIGLFQRAIVADPNYALAYAGLADSYTVAAGYGALVPPSEALPLADEASRKAVELDDASSDAHTARANALACQWKWSEAETEYKRAIALNPNNATAHYFYAFTFLMPQNRMDQSLDEFRVALSLDPLSGIVRVNYALTLMMARKNSEALQEIKTTLESDPSFGAARFYGAQLYATLGLWPEAVPLLQKNFRTPVPGSFSPDAQGFVKLMLAAGRQAPPTNLAVAYALAGDREQAMDSLGKAYAQRDDELMACIRFPAFDSLHNDPRWAALLAKMGLPV